MIEELDAALRRLLGDCAADAAVVWVTRPDEQCGTVVRTCPAALLAPDTSWTADDPDPAAVTESLRAVLPAGPAAARAFTLSPTLRLLIVWRAPEPGAARPEGRLLGEIGWLAQLMSAQHHEHDEMGRQAVLLDGLGVGLVSVAGAYDFAHVNDTAAKLLSIPPGSASATEFAAALDRLAGRAVHPAEALSDITRVVAEPGTELNTTWRFPDAPGALGVVSNPAPHPWSAGRVWAFYENAAPAGDPSEDTRANALIRAGSDAILDPQVLVEAVRTDGRIADLVYRDVNRAACEHLGLPREELVDHSLTETLPNLDESGLLRIYANCADTGEPVVLDGFPYQNQVLGDLRYFDIRAARAGRDFISLTWRDVTERSELTRRISLSEERFRLLAENMADVVVRIRDGRISWISNSVETALGAPPYRWIGQPVADFVIPEDLPDYREMASGLSRGQTHIGRFRVLAADGLPHWIHLHVKLFHEADGTPDGIVASFRVIDREVEAEHRAREQIALRDAQNRNLTRRLQDQSDRLMAEMNSAARYVTSILPGDLGGPVRVSSRYVPSRELGGDIYDYRWVDDDHLIFYLVDVSGHGVEAAMVSVSVQNTLRCGTLSGETLLHPDRTLSALNRLFRMDDHDGNYFTIWYGVYQASTRTLRYAGAGHPPAIVLAADGSGCTPLRSDSIPIGIATDAEFPAATYRVPDGAEIVLYSDGAFELTMPDGRQGTLEGFVDLCAQSAGSPDWNLDTLIGQLQNRSISGLFDDDCTLVRLSLD